MCAGLCPTYWTTFGIAEKIEMVAVLCTNETTPMSFPLFLPPGGRWPPKGEKTRPDQGYARMQNLVWIGLRVAEKSLTEQTNKHTVKQIPRPSFYERMAVKKTYSKTNASPIALTSEWLVINNNNNNILYYTFWQSQYAYNSTKNRII